MRGFGAYVAALGLVVVSAQSSQYSDFTSLVSVYDSATCNTTALFSQVTVGSGCVQFGSVWLQASCLLEVPSSASLRVCTDAACATCTSEPAVTSPLTCQAVTKLPPGMAGVIVGCTSVPNAAAGGVVIGLAVALAGSVVGLCMFWRSRDKKAKRASEAAARANDAALTEASNRYTAMGSVQAVGGHRVTIAA